MPIKSWSTTASGNASQGNINFAEGQNPSTVNNSARELMAQIRQEYVPVKWGWVAFSGTASAPSQTVVKISGNQTSDYTANRAVKMFGGSTTLYGSILSSSFTTETTITMQGLSGSVSTASMSIIALSTIYDKNLPANVVTGSGTATFTAETVFQATASFSALAKFGGPVGISATLSVIGVATFGNSVSFSKSAKFAASVFVSGTLSVGALYVGGTAITGNAGSWSLIGSTAIGAAQTSEVKFSGAFTQYVAFKMFVMNMASSASGSANIKLYTDGGTTPFLTLPAGTMAAGPFSLDYDIFGSQQATKVIKVHGNMTGINSSPQYTATSNAGTINCIGWTTSGGAVTISAGTVVLYGCKG